MDWGLLSVALVWLVLVLVGLTSAAALAVLGRKAWRKGLGAVLLALLLVVLVTGILHGSDRYFEIALLIALFGFVSSAAMAKFLLRGEVIE